MKNSHSAISWLGKLLYLLLFLCSFLLIIVLFLVIINAKNSLIATNGLASPNNINSVVSLSNASQWVVASATFIAAVFASFAFYFSKLISRFETKNAVFTQMYSLQNVIVNKRDYDFATMTISHIHVGTLSGNAYSLFREYIVHCMYKSENDLNGMADIWTDFSNHVVCRNSAKLSQAFKYLHDEINWIYNSESELLSQEKKWGYVNLVQTQLNYDQLLCYMFNLARYFSTRLKSPAADAFIKLLRDSGFFENLYDNYEYRNLLKEHIKGSTLRIFIRHEFINEVDNRI